MQHRRRMLAPATAPEFVLIVVMVFVATACAGARDVGPTDGSTREGVQRDRGITFGDGRGDGPPVPTFDGTPPPLPDGPRPDGPRASDTTVDARRLDTAPGIADEDKDGHCAPGQVDPTGSTCKSFKDCDDKDPTRHPDAVETCANRGVDNDCDGDSTEVDVDKDGVDDIGQICQTGLPGECSTGKKACVGGSQLQCVPGVAVGSVSETCNGKDDDCDNSVDEGNLCAAGETCAGSAGCRCGSGPACASNRSCCGGACINIASSTSHCGACGVSCGSSETCSSSRCRCGTTSGGVGAGPACGAGSSCNGTSCSVPCNGSINLASSATPTSSGGGQTSLGFGPEKMNDGRKEATCTTDKFHWINAPSGSGTSSHWIQYSWPAAVSIGRVVFDTVVASTGGCGATAGRSLAGGSLQYLVGASWVTLTTIANQAGDWSRSFGAVTTTAIRLVNAHAHSSGNPNPVIIEWEVFCQ